MKKNHYECAMCHGVFRKGVSDEEALNEFREDFPTVPLEDADLICDHCYEKITEDVKKNPWKYPPLP